MTYFHFHGEKAVRQIIVLPDRNVKLSAQVPALESFSMCGQDFSEIGWEYPHFIQEEEFESVWNEWNFPFHLSYILLFSLSLWH